MAKGSANERAMGNMHATLARVYTAVLKKYELQFEVLEKLASDEEALATEMVEMLMAVAEPNPAMLSGISKFLKDNEIMYDAEEVAELSAQQRRLQEMAAKRKGNVVTLDNLPVAADG